MMEFEEMQKIWNEHKGETMYAINETALHKIVTRKRDAASRRINRVETRISLINGILAILLFVLAMQGHPLLFLSSGLFGVTVAYIQYFRWKRKKAENTFDRSILGELDQALSNTNYIIRLNYFGLVYLIFLVLVTTSQMIVRGDSLWEWLVLAGSVLLSFFLIRWEQNVCNMPGKNQLLALKKKLTEE